ncbi:MAG: fatty acid--CoA ligase family protein [Deltaproteobacteria bacterium]|nr:fatty acid--CoA ligase family protein [Deltaproteobacteria bacterium]
MPLTFLLEVFAEHTREDAFVFAGRASTYGWLTERIEHWAAPLREADIDRGTVVMLEAGFSPDAVALLLALLHRGAIVVPAAPSSQHHTERFAEIAQVEAMVRIDAERGLQARPTGCTADHPLYDQLGEHPGLVLFTSGSTGEPKGIVHDVTRLLDKYRVRRRCHRTVAFLLFDHIGGLDTALYSLSNGSCLVLVDDRTPDGVCQAVQDHRAEVLPVAPSFLNLLALSGAHQRYDLSSLRFVTYGAEMMPAATLDRCQQMFPGVTLLQKYGTSEVGTLRSKSRSSDSLWVKIGGEGYQTRVVDGQLEILARSSMLGYLNADSPFTADGWFKTGDDVEVDGEYIRFLGRASDVINVGGRKVHPAEVEGIILALPNIDEVAVMGEANPLMGQIVCAQLRTVTPEDLGPLRRRVREACRQQLDAYKVPIKIELATAPLTSARHKVHRHPTP